MPQISNWYTFGRYDNPWLYGSINAGHYLVLNNNFGLPYFLDATFLTNYVCEPIYVGF